MKSDINLSITIDHEENLPADAGGVANEVARHLTGWLGLSEGVAVVVDGRNHISGPVRVFLRSAAFSSQRSSEEEGGS